MTGKKRFYFAIFNFEATGGQTRPTTTSRQIEASVRIVVSRMSSTLTHWLTLVSPTSMHGFLSFLDIYASMREHMQSHRILRLWGTCLHFLFTTRAQCPLQTSFELKSLPCHPALEPSRKSSQV